MASAPTDWQAYIKANPDLGAAGISTPEQAQQHWQQFGQYENRPVGGAIESSPATNVPMSNGTATGLGNFYGYNGNSYSTSALDPSASSFQASNGQTYTKQQINDWYNAIDPATGMPNRASYGADMNMMAQLGLQAPDLYKARYLGGTSDTSTGIYTPAAEMAPYGDYLKGAQKTVGVNNALSFYDWRAKQTPEYLAALAKGTTGNLGYINGPDGGTAINYAAGNAAPNTAGGATVTGGSGTASGPLTTTGDTNTAPSRGPLGSSLVNSQNGQGSYTYGSGPLTQVGNSGANPYQHIYRADQQGPWMNFHSDGQPSAPPLEFHAQPASSRYASAEAAPPQDQVGALTQAGV